MIAFSPLPVGSPIISASDSGEHLVHNDPELDMEPTRLEGWLAAYGHAWEKKDTQAFVALFTPDAYYHWTPFEEPRKGREAIAEAFEAAVARQADIRFEAMALTGNDAIAIAHWQCSFERIGRNHTVRLDGIFLMDFADDGLCRVFREWWHSDEKEPV